MSNNPGFSRSLATSYVQYLTYSYVSGRGFAVGVHGGESSFEVSSDHTAFFRGSVGLGTAAPGAILDVAGAGDGVNLLKFTTDRPWVFQQQGTGSGAHLVLRSLAGGKWFKIQEHDGTDVFKIRSNTGDSYFKGAMGIGTTSPESYKLAVE